MIDDNSSYQGPQPVPEETVLGACDIDSIPEMATVEQLWETNPIAEKEFVGYTAKAIDTLDFSNVPKGGEVAIGAGSRGISNISTIINSVVNDLSRRGYDPFVFPAMGSHGGATAEGQVEMLASLGVTEDSIGCEIRATMETEVVGETPDRGVEVHADVNAANADAILPVNRIKPHTDFQGEVESGLSKMLVIGMGKQRGARTAHKWALDWSFRNMLPEIASLIIEKLPVVGGIAIVEDEHDETAVLEGIPPSGFLSRERELLEEAYKHMPTIPFDDIDVLIIDQMGKEVSGTGMDTNVTGRLVHGNEPSPEKPDIDRIFVRSLTSPSHGNATAVGAADFIHKNLFDNIDISDTLVNMLTASGPQGARIPAPIETDRAGIIACLSTIGVTPPEEARVVRIRDTMHLERIKVSPSLLEEARGRTDLNPISDSMPIAFDDNGQYEEKIIDV